MRQKNESTFPAASQPPKQPPQAPTTDSDDAPVGDELDPNTTYDVIVSPTGFVTEVSDTIDAMDGAAVEVIDIVNEADGTNLELTIVQEATDTPNVDSVDRFFEINGIGPEIARLLTQAGIRHFSQLAETPIERIREILTAAGIRYRIHDATTWPEQARKLANPQPGDGTNPNATGHSPAQA